MNEVRGLAIYAADDVAVDMAVVKRAKAALDLPYQVRPEPARDLGGGRVLAFGKPDWLCDFFLVSEHTDDERMQRALAWVLGEVEHDDEATLVADTLSVTFGGDVREIPPAELASEKAWEDYLSGR